MATKKKTKTVLVDGVEQVVEDTTVFGVYQGETGSYTVGDARFVPLTAVPVFSSIADTCDEDESPVKFYETEEKAKEAIEKLQNSFARKPKV